MRAILALGSPLSEVGYVSPVASSRPAPRHDADRQHRLALGVMTVVTVVVFVWLVASLATAAFGS
jgi:hypothetical protein